MARSPQPDTNPGRAGPFGSSIILSVTIVGVVMLILVLGSVLIFQGLGSDDDDSTAIPSPQGTSELVSGIPTAPDDDAEGSPTATTATDSPSLTASPTGVTVTPDATESEPTPTEDATEPVEPDPTATEEDTEPTVPNEPDSTPTDLPLEGGFGLLPPAQLPSGGVSSTLSLEYQLTMSLESLPGVGTVYLLNWPLYTLEDVELARDRLALQAAVVEEGVGVYRVESDRGMLFVSPTEIIFRAAGFGDGSGVPGDADAIAFAREWIELSGFIAGSMDSGSVVAREEEPPSAVVKFRPVEPQPNLAPNPSATVHVGSGGTVMEVRIAWPASLEPSDYGYSDPLAVWQAVQNGQGFLEADISSVLAAGQLTGTASISDYSTAYTLAGSPAGSQYLVPLITFHGTARIDQTGDEIPVSVSIPVVYFEEGTAG